MVLVPVAEDEDAEDDPLLDADPEDGLTCRPTLELPAPDGFLLVACCPDACPEACWCPWG